MKVTPLTGIAKRVHDDIMSLDPEAARLYATMVVGAALEHDLETHTALIDHRVRAIVAKRAEKIKQGLRSAAVSKALSGQEIDHLQAAADVISKAAPGFDHLSTAERQQFVRMQDRDPGGRFKTMNRKITYRTTVPLKGRNAEVAGIPRVPTDSQGAPYRFTNKADRARFQQAYLQVSDMLGQFADAPAGSGKVFLTYRNPVGGYETVISTLDEKANIDPTKFNRGGKLVDAQVIVDGNASPEAASFNLVAALGSPYLAGRAAAATQVDQDGFAPGAQRLGRFADDWDERLQEDATNPANRIFRRLRHGSSLLTDMAGDNIPVQAKLALRTADLVGQYGPEAQKVIGPHADRAAYRYRGVEKTPDAVLQQQINRAMKLADVNGKNLETARNALLYGMRVEHARRPGEAPRREWVESPLVEYFKGRLADKELTHLQRKSGVIPPSEGIIVDRKGKVATQAVGYGDDWYLPFNLKTLSKLKGGDYIRTRTWGGPTTEDIYAGLVSGARSVTVVSHNGVYVIEFDDTFRGKRRYNDKAARMVKRYGHLLDAAKSKQVTADIPPEREQELRDEVTRETGLDPRRREDRREFEAKLEEARRDEYANPTMPEAHKRQVAEEFANGKASHLKTAEGYAADWTALAAQRVARDVGQLRQFHNDFTPDLTFNEDEAKAAVTPKYGTPEALIAAMGWDKEFATALEHAEAEYKAKYGPLKLDGEGYHQSLRALKEQFPYYIANVDYRPNERSGKDWGYVKPKFNRPEEALGGYFDPSITGASGLTMGGQVTGKVTADRMRFQNPAGLKMADALRREQKKKEDERQSTRSGSSSAAGRSAGRAGAQATEEDRYDALKKLYDRISQAENYAIAGPGAGAPIDRAAIFEGARPYLAQFFNKGWDQWLDEFVSDKQSEDRFVALARAVKAKGIVDVEESLFRDIRKPGGAKAGEPFVLMKAIADPNRDFDFGDDPEAGHFKPGLRPEQYRATEMRVLRRLGLEQMVDDPARDTRLDQLLAKQKDLRHKAARAGMSRDKERAERLITDIVKAKQARRMAEKAEQELADLEELRRERAMQSMPRVLDISEDPLGAALKQQLKPHDKTISGELE